VRGGGGAGCAGERRGVSSGGEGMAGDGGGEKKGSGRYMWRGTGGEEVRVGVRWWAGTPGGMVLGGGAGRTAQKSTSPCVCSGATREELGWLVQNYLRGDKETEETEGSRGIQEWGILEHGGPSQQL
jgi:hypothetical protein